jgi:hypothetical protein
MLPHVYLPRGYDWSIYIDADMLIKRPLTELLETLNNETLFATCITLRDNTERPETCGIGTNELIGTNPDNIAPAFNVLLSGNWKKGGIPWLKLLLVNYKKSNFVYIDFLYIFAKNIIIFYSNIILCQIISKIYGRRMRGQVIIIYLT